MGFFFLKASLVPVCTRYFHASVFSVHDLRLHNDFSRPSVKERVVLRRFSAGAVLNLQIGVP